MAEKSLEQFLSDVLNGRIPAVARLADLPAWWRRTPPGFARQELLDKYIDKASTEAWANEGLRALLRYLLESFVKPPPDLVEWAVQRCAYGDPPPKRGRPEEVDDDNLVTAVFAILQANGYSREAAICFIADETSRGQETIRSKIRKLKLRRGLPLRIEAAREFLRR